MQICFMTSFAALNDSLVSNTLGVGERHTASGVTVKRPEMMAKSMSLPPIAPTLTKDAEVSECLKC